MKVEQNEVVLSNGEYFSAYCTEKDLCRINRMWLRFLDSGIGRDAPRWLKEEAYNVFLWMRFDRAKWDACAMTKEVRSSGSLLSKVKKEALKLE